MSFEPDTPLWDEFLSRMDGRSDNYILCESVYYSHRKARGSSYRVRDNVLLDRTSRTTRSRSSLREMNRLREEEQDDGSHEDPAGDSGRSIP